MYKPISKNDGDVQPMRLSTGRDIGDDDRPWYKSNTAKAGLVVGVVCLLLVVLAGASTTTTAGGLSMHGQKVQEETITTTTTTTGSLAGTPSSSGSATMPTKTTAKVEFDADKFHSEYLKQGAFSDFWEESRSVLSHSGELEESRKKFRQWIWENQNPDDCDAANLCTCNARHGGMFSHVHSRVVCLMHAIVNKCTLVENVKTSGAREGPGTYVNHDLCTTDDKSSNFECYFQPISKCSNVEVLKRHSKKIERIETYQKCNYFERKFATIKAKTGLTSRLLVNGEMLAYLMRPSQRLRNSVDMWSKRLGLFNQGILRNTLSVHIRHGDKRGVDKQEKKNTRMVGAANTLQKMYGYRKIHYMSDDPHAGKILELIGADYDDVEVTHIPFIEFPSVRTAMRKNEVGSSDVNTTIATVSENDEGLLIITQVVLMAQGSMLLGTQVSNMDRAILELMSAVKYPPETYDMYGDVYTPCASHESHHDWNIDSQHFWDESNGIKTSDIDIFEGEILEKNGEDAGVATAPSSTSTNATAPSGGR